MMAIEKKDDWSLDRKVTVSGVVAVLMLAASVLTVYIKMNDRLNSVEIALTYQKGVNDQLKENQKENKRDTADALVEVKSSLKDLSLKVDRLLERK